jgi:hypothetical protein
VKYFSNLHQKAPTTNGSGLKKDQLSDFNYTQMVRRRRVKRPSPSGNVVMPPRRWPARRLPKNRVSSKRLSV